MLNKNNLVKTAKTANIIDSHREMLFENLDEMLTTNEAAIYLKISKGSLLNMVWRKQIIPYKLGRRNRYYKKDLSLLISSSNSLIRK